MTEEHLTKINGIDDSADSPEAIVNETQENLDDAKAPEIKENQDNPDVIINQLKNDISDQKDKYLRLFAEFDNFKKRSLKERIELIKSASQDLMVDLLPILDDFERAKKLAEDQSNENIFPEGMSLVYHKLLNTLQNKGLQAMESNNQVFDSNFHEAITEFPASSNDQKGKVFDTVEKGYLLHEKIIRFAKVVVAK